MSLKEKFKFMMGIDEEYEDDMEYAEYEEEEIEEPVAEPAILKVDTPKAAPVLRSVPATPKETGSFTSVTKEKGAVLPMQPHGESSLSLESHLNKVIIREPSEYSDASGIADCLKENFPVFINLQRLEKAQAKRVVDFLSGTIYAIDGDIKRVGTNLFLCTPKNVETEGQVSLQELQLDAVE